MSLVLDASVAACWFLPDERGPDVSSVLARVVAEGAHVPALFRWEIQNSLLSAERRRRVVADEVDAALDFIRDLPIVIDEVGERLFSGTELGLARHYALTPYDAAYLALAVRLRLPLATLDAALLHAAADLNVATMP